METKPLRAIAYIYVLSDPRKPKAIRYCGQTTKTPEVRRAEHIGTVKSAPARAISRWITSLRKVGLIPDVSSVETIDVTGLNHLEVRILLDTKEVYWIQELTQQGHKLVNRSNGGRGNSGIKFSKATLKKRSQALKGKAKSESQIEKLRTAAHHQYSGKAELARKVFMEPGKHRDVAERMNVSLHFVHGVKSRTHFAWATEGLIKPLYDHSKTPEQRAKIRNSIHRFLGAPE